MSQAEVEMWSEHLKKLKELLREDPDMTYAIMTVVKKLKLMIGACDSIPGALFLQHKSVEDFLQLL